MYPAKYVPATGQPGLLVSSAESNVFLPLIRNEEDSSSSTVTFSISYPASDADLETASAVIPEADPLKGLNGSMYIFKFGEGIFNFTVPFMYRTDPLWNGTVLIYGAGKDRTIINCSAQYFIYNQAEDFNLNIATNSFRVELQNLTLNSTYTGSGVKNSIWLRGGVPSLRLKNVKIVRIPETDSDLIDQGLINLNPLNINDNTNQDKLYMQDCEFGGCMRTTIMTARTTVAKNVTFLAGTTGGYLYNFANVVGDNTDYCAVLLYTNTSHHDCYRIFSVGRNARPILIDNFFFDITTLEA